MADGVTAFAFIRLRYREKTRLILSMPLRGETNMRHFFYISTKPIQAMSLGLVTGTAFCLLAIKLPLAVSTFWRNAFYPHYDHSRVLQIDVGTVYPER